MSRLPVPLQIAWSILWRLTVLFPFFFVFQIIVIASWLGRFLFPVLSALHLFAGELLAAAAYATGSALSILLWRWQPFRSLIEAPKFFV